MEHHEHMDHKNMTPSGPLLRHGGYSGMVEDFRRRFWISLIITLPILALSPVIQQFLHLGNSLRFSGDSYILWAVYGAGVLLDPALEAALMALSTIIVAVNSRLLRA
jgi:hypothetical protein